MANKKQVDTASKMIDNPRISSITSGKLPEIKNWEIGKKYKLEVEVTMKGIREDEYDNDKIKADFNIESIKAVK